MQKKITIIGAGAVGATTAFALLTRGAASEVVLIDVNTEKALGEALDIKQATPFIDNCDIYAGSYLDAVGSDVVIITSGIGRKPRDRTHQPDSRTHAEHRSSCDG